MGFSIENTEYIINRKDSPADSRKTYALYKKQQQWSVRKWLVKPESNSNQIWYWKTIILENKSELQD